MRLSEKVSPKCFKGSSPQTLSSARSFNEKLPQINGAVFSKGFIFEPVECVTDDLIRLLEENSVVVRLEPAPHPLTKLL